MQKWHYRIGDTILLKSGVLGSSGPSGYGRILSCLPEAQGTAQYRVQFDAENFERRILQVDIDAAASSSPTREASSMPEGKLSSWVNSSAISIRKR
nr:cold-shock protein [Rhizobium sp. P28RR-XV]